MLHLKGAGLPNVQLLSGFEIHGEGDEESISYQDLDGLYNAIATAVACRGANMTSHEMRFMRKRLGKTQEQIGDLCGVGDQSVAKWEKGTTDVPIGAARLVRLAWLHQHEPSKVNRAIEKMWHIDDFVGHGYVFDFDGKKWKDVSHNFALRPIQVEAQQVTSMLMTTLMVDTQHADFFTIGGVEGSGTTNIVVTQ